MIEYLFFGFWIYTAGFVSGMLVFPLFARVILNMVKRGMKR